MAGSLQTLGWRKLYHIFDRSQNFPAGFSRSILGDLWYDLYHDSALMTFHQLKS